MFSKYYKSIHFDCCLGSLLFTLFALDLQKAPNTLLIARVSGFGRGVSTLSMFHFW